METQTALALYPMAMLFGLFGGLAFFLMGMEILSDGLKAAAGDRMRLIVERFTKNRVSAALTGAGVTAAIQSSSITTVLVVGFVSAGVMTLTQSVGVIMGANVGTTVTAQLVAFRVDEAAVPLIVIGFFSNALAKRGGVHHFGAILLGLGLVFFGMAMMSEAMRPLRSFEPFAQLMAGLSSRPLLAVLVSAAFTALVQSSSATTGIVVVMAGSGLVTLEAGIALALGANIGTCVTALLSALGKPVEARRAAAVHVIFNVLGAVIWLPMLGILASIALAVSPSQPDLESTARLAAEAPRQIANANTLFNLINTVVFLFFADFIARLAIWLVPDRTEPAKELVTSSFIDPSLLDTPAFAIRAARLETARLGGFATEMLRNLQSAVPASDLTALAETRRNGERSAVLFARIIDYIGGIERGDLSATDRAGVQRLAVAATEFNALADLIAERLVPIVEQRLRENTVLAPETAEALAALYRQIAAAIDDAIVAVRENDELAAYRVIEAKQEVVDATNGLAAVEGIDLTTPTGLLQMRSVLSASQLLRLLYSITRRAAKTVLPPEVGGGTG